MVTRLQETSVTELSLKSKEYREFYFIKGTTTNLILFLVKQNHKEVYFKLDKS